jgi:uncharacterized protein (DUF1015 family)
LALIQPFQPYRYTAKAGDPAKLVTQPYDKISPAMQARYLAASPYNLVRVIFGERRQGDTESDNVYTRAAGYFNEWIRDGILAQDAKPGFYVYTQDFQVPGMPERATRTGFIGIGKVEDYAAGIVFRHEQTLAGPKKDRLELLRHTRAHFGHIFMLYSEPGRAIDRLLEGAARGVPLMDVADEYQARHRLWPVTDASFIARLQDLMADKKLLIADGHHRYETALAYRNEHPDDPAAQYVMMTFINLHSPGLKILATHRVLRNVPGFDAAALRAGARRLSSAEALKQEFARKDPLQVRIGVAVADGIYLIQRERRDGELDVPVLHSEILQGKLGIPEEAVRNESYITYVRGLDEAVAEVGEKGAQVAFLLEPTPVEEMARIAFGGGVMPQKSTDFYPKLLGGVTIYKL